ncbi:DNA-binding ferritin-like protein [Campylobacter blaseri]|uniref:DNA starvation/stationary phase protection protein n=1 Tax=Campylobacter blaseri TaxID=2042961 RepID=A0A2P8QZ38_9BACT|nr:DNA starvation/stationary phase protection protein [Campylobacter blaseri]PSM51509.1 DNA starvation/stationary phase protection protein [Campylobacter blaseri]PSM52958.1 DNA starvation/stationary phase protection protein [Campylobacter blaseri]QKF86480.1 DNA-binding ferritin-like protein [Campylobacter blaseri]
MSKVVEQLNQIQADALALNIKFHNYHWNVLGKQFFSIHNYTEEAYDDFFELFDEVAERAIQIGGKALVDAKKMIEMSKAPKTDKDSFTDREVVELVREDFKYLLGEFRKLAEIADEAGDRPTTALAEDNIAKYEKSIWMLNQTLA